MSKKQWQIVKDLGYKYRGKNQWLYFMSFEPGYAPFNLDQDEVLRMTEYLQGLEKILEYYEENDVNIDFQNGNILCMIEDRKNNTVRFEEEPLPFFEYCPGVLIASEDEEFHRRAEAYASVQSPSGSGHLSYEEHPSRIPNMTGRQIHLYA